MKESLAGAVISGLVFLVFTLCPLLRAATRNPATRLEKLVLLEMPLEKPDVCRTMSEKTCRVLVDYV
jgi:hypothetical protein